MQKPVPKIGGGPNTNSRSGRQNRMLIVSMVALLVAGLIGMAAWLVFQDQTAVGADPQPKPRRIIVADSAVTAELPLLATENSLVADDGKTLWVSPTAGHPIDLRFLPPGCQLFLAIRPAALLTHPEGDKILAALGPAGQEGTEFVERLTRLPLVDIDRLLVGIQVAPDGAWQGSFVVYPINPAKVADVLRRMIRISDEHGLGEEFIKVGDWAYLSREATNGQALVIAPASRAPDILELTDAVPPLRREIEQLVAVSDDQRQVNLLFAPNYLYSDGQILLNGLGSRLQRPLDWFLGDELRAVLLSLHWTDDFFLELRAMSTIETRGHLLADRLAAHLAALPLHVEDYVDQLDIQPFAHRLVTRLPAMTRSVAQHTRCGHEGECAVLRTYLPLAAGHNLLMATELSLVEPLRGASTATSVESQVPQTSTIAERLAQPASLSFQRETWETALKTLAEEIGVRIEIIGADLKRDGITRNQLIGIDTHDEPAEQILLAILQRANPDKSATGPADPRQKLIYVIRSDPVGEDETLLISTRAAAAQRGEALPVVFRGR